MKKRVLLLALPFMDIYKDIIDCLKSKGFDVTWVSDGTILYNPYNKNNITRHTKTISEYQTEVNEFWDETFKKDEFQLPFDYFLAIDGFMVTPHFFKILEDKNPNIRKILYLYDRVAGNYEIDIFFPYYTSIFSFDMGDCSHFGLNHLPIYWVPAKEKSKAIYDIFGMGNFQWGTRYDVYKAIKSVCRKHGLRDFVKLYYRPVDDKLSYMVKYLFYMVQGKKMLSLFELKNDLFTSKSLTPNDFRDYISISKVVLDTHLSYQDGLTARFMWALGEGKKIITTNPSVTKYDFYTSDQIYVLDDKNIEGVVDFIKKDFKIDVEIRDIVDKYRIDNWLDTMLGVYYNQTTKLC